MSSPLKAIEDTVLAAAQSVDGMAPGSWWTVPLTKLILGQKEDGTLVLDQLCMPRGYPGGTLSVNDAEADILGQPNQQYSSGLVWFSVPVYTVTWATSDGEDLDEARHRAWDLDQALLVKLMTVTPVGGPDGVTFNVLEPSWFEQLVSDANSHAVLRRFLAKYCVSVKR